MEVFSLLQQVGVSPLQVLDSFIEKLQVLLADKRDVTDTPTCEELITVLNGIKQLFESLAEKDKTNAAPKILQNVCSIYLKSCLNRQKFVNGSDRLQENTASVIGQIFVCVYHYISQEKIEAIFRDIINMILKMLETSNVNDTVIVEETTDSAYLPLQLMAVSFLSILCDDAILLHQIFSAQPDYDQHILQRILSVLKHSSLSLSYRIAGQVLPHIIQRSSLPSIMAERVWDFVCSIWSNLIRVETNSSDMVLTLLCCLHHLFISSSASLFSDSNGEHTGTLFDVRVKPIFWNIVQNALKDSNPLSRKRGMFLLHKALCSVNMLPNDTVSRQGNDSELGPDHIELGPGHSEGYVFWWGGCNHKEHIEVQSIWECVVLLLETLEEKQVHIVKPLLGQLKKLMSATQKCIDGHCMLHLSWVGIIFQRLFVHDSRSIVKLGVCICLEMKLDQSPLLLRNNWQIIFDPLVSILREAYIFAREDHDTDQSPVCPSNATLLVQFLQEIITQIPTDTKESFFGYLLNCLSLKNVPDIPMLYISYALSCIICPNTYLITTSSLPALRLLVKTSLSTHRAKLRAATQCFLLKCLCRHLDPNVEFVEFFQTIGCYSTLECLVYGSSAWVEASDCLYQVAITDRSGSNNLLMFLQSVILELLQSESHTQPQVHIKPQVHAQPCTNPTVLSRAILLSLTTILRATVDHRKTLCNNQSLEEIILFLLSPVLDIISSARTRAYINYSKLLSAVNLLNCILQFHIDGEELLTDIKINEGVGSVLYFVLLPWLPDVLLFLAEGLLRGSELLDSSVPSLKHVSLYRSCLNCVYTVMDRNWYQWNENQDFSIYSLTKRSLVTMLKIDTPDNCSLTAPILGAISTLEYMCGLIGECQTTNQDILKLMIQLPINLTLTKPQFEEELNHDSQMIEYGPIINYCLSSYWKCLLCVFNNIPSAGDPSNGQQQNSLISIGSMDWERIANLCVEYMDIIRGSLATPLNCLVTLVPKLSLSYIVTTISTIWPLVKGLKYDLKQLLDSLSVFLSVAFHHCLLTMSEDSDLLEIQLNIINDIIGMAEDKVGVFNLLVTHLSKEWRWLLLNSDSNQNNAVVSIRNKMVVLIEGAAFGPVFRKNLRTGDDVEAFVNSLGNSCSSNEIKWRLCETDRCVRIQVLCLLIELGSLMTSATHSECPILSSFILNLVSILETLSIDRPKYYINSFTHRYRLRIVQILLSIHHFANKEIAKNVVMTLWRCLENDNQLSLRYSMEWLVVLLCHKYPNILENTLLSQMAMGSGRRLSRLCSVFTIAMQYGKCMDNDSDKFVYYSKVLPLVFRWCFCYHFVVRLYAVGSFLEMWNESSYLLNELPQFSLFPGFIEFIKNYSDVSKSKKLQMNVFFSHIHPLKDYCIEVIYYILPALTGVIHEELISLNVFNDIASSTLNSITVLPLKCSNKCLLVLLDNCDVSFDRPQIIQQFDPTEDRDIICDEGNKDVQKKITPWSNSQEILCELFPDMCSIETKLHGSNGGLILVASLLQKPPNLGGLCRTCEIFGVSEIVFSSKSVIEEKEFKSLSVTAEKWVNISEVKPINLRDYLLTMRQKGYTLVGIEQTAHSRNITSYRFPGKTLLLLGNEKQGIPVELIHLLDDCVEIPQFGTVRSLNVHVSGALIIWEYTKQHKLNY